MKEINLFCDICGEKVKWLYEIPRIVIEGYNISWYRGKYGLCRKCTKKLCDLFNNYVIEQKGVSE